MQYYVCTVPDVILYLVTVPDVTICLMTVPDVILSLSPIPELIAILLMHGTRCDTKSGYGNGAKCATMLVILRKVAVASWLSHLFVGSLSIPTVPTLCLKDLLTGNEIIHVEIIRTAIVVY